MEQKQSLGTKPVILVVSFGTSCGESREKTIGAVERAIAAAWPDHEVRRAFTSRVILDILKRRDHLEIDHVEEALERLVRDGKRTLVVQPTHVMSGYEYDGMMAVVERFRDKFDFVAVGGPLLTWEEDYDRVAAALAGETAACRRSGAAVVFMGHGTEHAANLVYTRLQERFDAAGADGCLVGTVEAEPSLEDMLAAVKRSGRAKVVLEPLMVVAGDHANHDMAGDGEGSWKSAFQAAGYQVETVLRGLGELEAIQQIYVDHVRRAAGGETPDRKNRI